MDLIGAEDIWPGRTNDTRDLAQGQIGGRDSKNTENPPTNSCSKLFPRNVIVKNKLSKHISFKSIRIGTICLDHFENLHFAPR